MSCNVIQQIVQHLAARHEQQQPVAPPPPPVHHDARVHALMQQIAARQSAVDQHVADLRKRGVHNSEAWRMADAGQRAVHDPRKDR